MKVGTMKHISFSIGTIGSPKKKFLRPIHICSSYLDMVQQDKQLLWDKGTLFGTADICVIGATYLCNDYYFSYEYCAYDMGINEGLKYKTVLFKAETANGRCEDGGATVPPGFLFGRRAKYAATRRNPLALSQFNGVH